MVSSLRMTAVSASFLGLPSSTRTFVEALENRVVLGGDEGGHVEAGADLGAAAPDGAPAAHGTAVPVEGGDADQGGDLPSVEAAEFGQVGDQGAGGGLADAGHALEQVLGLAPGRGAPDGGVDLGLEIGQFALERLEQPVDALEGAPAGQAAPGGCARRSSSRRSGAGGRPALRARGPVRRAPAGGAGATASAKWAIAAASRASVLASWPVDRAKSRIWRGLTTASGRPAAHSAAATVTS